MSTPRRLAVIMAGGSGERFWPVSTRERPKQFLHLSSPQASLIQEAVGRAESAVGAGHVGVVTGRHLAAATLAANPQLTPDEVWAEPSKRNTGGAMVWTAANVMARYEDWALITLAMLSADHRIAPEARFVADVQLAMHAAEDHGAIVTIGIQPTRPETGYGYIETSEPTPLVAGVHHPAMVESFREKPDRATAELFVQTGRFLWNSGMFFLTIPTLLAEMEHAAPELASATRAIAGHLRAHDMAAAESAFAELPDVSFDYAVMERARKVMVVAATFDWDDLGSWDAVARTYPADAQGNVALGTHRAEDAERNVVYVDGTDQCVSLLGVSDLVVVVTEGQVLVCPKDRAQEVKRLARPAP
jgi:mannose-1-phosphate guanylyltransferase